MNARRAMSQIDAIWSQVARSETFHGYRPATVASTGIFGIAGAAIQPHVSPDPLSSIDRYLLLWVTIATVSVLVVGVELSLDLWRMQSRVRRRLCWLAIEQFLPTLATGALITWIVPMHSPEAVALMPGLWGLCFSLGAFASRPYLTPHAVWIAFYYLVAGSVCLLLSPDGLSLSPWTMGTTFGGGQLLMAIALYVSRGERDG